MSVSKRIEKLLPKLAEKNLDAFFVSQPENRYYLSGFNGTAGYILITPDKKILATDFRYTEQAGIEAPDYEIFQITGEVNDWFPKLTSGLKGKIGFEARDITFSLHQRLAEAMSKAESKLELVPVEGVVESIRMIKEPGEIELITKAVEITDRAYNHAQNFIYPGVTEKQVAWEVEKFIREHGSEALAFEGIISCGVTCAMPHAKPSDHVLENGESMMIDIGSKYDLYCSDLTRSVCVGGCTDKFKEIYSIVLKAQLTAEEKIKAGMTGNEAHAIALDIIREAGYGDNFGHGLGHGLGLSIHEAPRVGLNSQDVLQDGMVFSVEPGIYLPGWGGVRIEDTVVMENGRVRPITRAPKLSF
jgi:Xaa-Pro aminopeptidase